MALTKSTDDRPESVTTATGENELTQDSKPTPRRTRVRRRGGKDVGDKAEASSSPRKAGAADSGKTESATKPPPRRGSRGRGRKEEDAVEGVAAPVPAQQREASGPIPKPAQKPVVQPQSPDVYEFGAGLFDEEPWPSMPVATPSAGVEDSLPPSSADAQIRTLEEPSPPSGPGRSDQEPQRGKPRRRRLGRGRREGDDRPPPQGASALPSSERGSVTARSEVGHREALAPRPGAGTTADTASGPDPEREAVEDLPDWMEDADRAPEGGTDEAPVWRGEMAESLSTEESRDESLPSEETSDKRRRRRRGGRRRRGRGEGAAAEETAREDAEVAPRPEATPAEDELDEDFVAAEPVDEAIPLASDPVGTGERELLINVAESEECRIAVLHQGRLEEIFIERQSAQSHVGNVYKARVTNVEPSIQAAFVDFGLPKHGFLHISDVHKKYFPGSDKSNEDVGRKIAKRDRPLIQRCLRRGQEIMVQVIKEGVGTKGPTVSTYLSIPGRFLVMMPGMGKLGVSRKIEDEEQRRQMRRVLEELTLPEGMGFILRTAGLEQTKRELQRDLNYLTRLWKKLGEREEKLPAPAELYREQDLVIRTMRDVYSSDFKRVVVDDAETAKRIRDFLRIAMPRAHQRIELYADREPMFHRFGIERELALLNSRRVPLPSGGSIVIDTGEAMTTIDVNSGRFRRPDNAEETALAINLEAAEEITRQLRLRDIGGIIVCDFIDMVHLANRRKVVNAMREGLRKHKERARVLNMSPFGLVEITRQRQRHSFARSLYAHCPVCDSSGWVKTPESVALDVIRILRYLVSQPQVHKIRCHVASGVALAVLNRKRAELSRLETDGGKTIEVYADNALFGEQMRLECEDIRGVALNLPMLPDVSIARSSGEGRNGPARGAEGEPTRNTTPVFESKGGEGGGRDGGSRRRRRSSRGRNRDRR